jgi:ribosomal protein L16 Arg81 hydroxylase
MQLNLKIDVVENISRDDFINKYFIPQKPVIIKNIIKEQPAAEKWTLDWFKDNHGDIEVKLYDSKKTNYNKTAITKHHLSMKFADYINTLQQNTYNDFRIFLFNIFKIRPQLKNDFACPGIFESFLKDKGFVFFGGKGSVTRMHQDIDMSNVLLTQFDGLKRVLLFSPQYSKLLYKLPYNTFSMVDIDNPDYEKFPGLKYVKGYDVTLERGDALFMPSGYWHHIIYTTAGFGVSYRKPGPGLKNIFTGLLYLVIYMPFDKLMNYLFKNKWYEHKKNIAIKRAQKEITKYQNK